MAFAGLVMDANRQGKIVVEEFDAEYSQFTFAGGGRYVVMHLPGERKLVIDGSSG